MKGAVQKQLLGLLKSGEKYTMADFERVTGSTQSTKGKERKTMLKLRLKNRKYSMPVGCAVEHLVNTILEKVPMGEREEVVAEIVRCLVMEQDDIKVPKFTYAGVIE